MEHILQFAVSIDDEGIKRNIEKSATDKISQELSKDIKKTLFDSGWGDGFSNYGEQLFRKFLDDHKDEILEKAVALVADSMKRSKKYREALAKIVEDNTDDGK